MTKKKDRLPPNGVALSIYLDAQDAMLRALSASFPTADDIDTATAKDLKPYALLAEIQRAVLGKLGFIGGDLSKRRRKLIDLALAHGQAFVKGYNAAKLREN